MTEEEMRRRGLTDLNIRDYEAGDYRNVGMGFPSENQLRAAGALDPRIPQSANYFPPRITNADLIGAGLPSTGGRPTVPGQSTTNIPWNDIPTAPPGPPVGNTGYIDAAVQSLLQPDRPQLRGATMDTAMWTPMSVERNFGPSGFDRFGNPQTLNPEQAALLYDKLSNRPVDLEYNLPRSADYPKENLQAATDLQEFGQNQEMNPLRLRQAEAQTRKTEGEAALAEATAQLTPTKQKLADSFLDALRTAMAGQDRISAARAQAKNDIVGAMTQYNMKTPEALWAWFDQQQEFARSQMSSIGRALKSILPDIDLEGLIGGTSTQPGGAGEPRGGPPGLSKAGQNLLNRYGG
jgi:hypothetical protein